MLYNSLSSKQRFSFKYFLNIKLNMRFNKLTTMELILSHFSNKHLRTYPIKNIVNYTPPVWTGDRIEWSMNCTQLGLPSIISPFLSLLYFTHIKYIRLCKTNQSCFISSRLKPCGRIYEYVCNSSFIR